MKMIITNLFKIVILIIMIINPDFNIFSGLRYMYASLSLSLYQLTEADSRIAL